MYGCSGHSSIYRSKYVFVFVGFFIRPFYKMMLGKQISLKDMESVVSFNTHCVNLPNQNITKLSECDLFFMLAHICRTVNTTTPSSGFSKTIPLS